MGLLDITYDTFEVTVADTSKGVELTIFSGYEKKKGLLRFVQDESRAHEVAQKAQHDMITLLTKEINSLIAYPTSKSIKQLLERLLDVKVSVNKHTYKDGTVGYDIANRGTKGALREGVTYRKEISGVITLTRVVRIYIKY